MRIISLLLMGCLSGCVSGQAHHDQLGVGAEIALIRLDTLHGAAISAPIFIDGTLVAEFGKCEWMAVQVAPGRHVVRTNDGSSIAVEPKPHNAAFVLIDPVSGAFTANFFLKEITRFEASQHVSGCREL